MSFTPVGKFEAPPPVELKVREIADGVLLSNWVKVRGTVRYVGMRDNKLILHLANNGGAQERLLVPLALVQVQAHPLGHVGDV